MIVTVASLIIITTGLVIKMIPHSLTWATQPLAEILGGSQQDVEVVPPRIHKATSLHWGVSWVSRVRVELVLVASQVAHDEHAHVA